MEAQMEMMGHKGFQVDGDVFFVEFDHYSGKLAYYNCFSKADDAGWKYIFSVLAASVLEARDKAEKLLEGRFDA